MRRSKAISDVGAASAGHTLVEMAVVVGLVGLILGTIATIYPALTDASVETQLFLMARSENEKARLQLTEDLQTTDSTRSDASGVPYFSILSEGAGTANAIEFRRAEGFDINAAEDIVTTRFSTPIRYIVNDAGYLIRRQNAKDRVIAQNVRQLEFSKNLEGAITLRIRTFYRQRATEHEVNSETQIIPRNVLKM